MGFFPEQQHVFVSMCLVDISRAFAGRMLENHQREQKEHYESQVAGLKLKVDHLQNESSKLQNLFQEKSNVNETIRQEVSRLSGENSVRLRLFFNSRSQLFVGTRVDQSVICAFLLPFPM